MSSTGDRIKTALSGLLKPLQSLMPRPTEAGRSETPSSLPPELSLAALSAVKLSDSSSTPSEKPTYALLPREWDEMVGLANHLAKREAEMPFRRRMQSFLAASNQAYSTRP